MMHDAVPVYLDISTKRVKAQRDIFSLPPSQTPIVQVSDKHFTRVGRISHLEFTTSQLKHSSKPKARLTYGQTSDVRRRADYISLEDE